MSGAIGFFQIGISGMGTGTSTAPGYSSGGAYYLGIASPGLWGFLVDSQQTPFDLSYVVEVPTGVATSFSVQYTLDDLNNLALSPIWLPDPNNGSTSVASVHGSYARGFGIAAIALNVSSLSGGPMRWAIIQGSGAR